MTEVSKRQKKENSWNDHAVI